MEDIDRLEGGARWCSNVAKCSEYLFMIFWTKPSQAKGFIYFGGHCVQVLASLRGKVRGPLQSWTQRQEAPRAFWSARPTGPSALEPGGRDRDKLRMRD